MDFVYIRPGYHYWLIPACNRNDQGDIYSYEKTDKDVTNVEYLDFAY